MDTKFWLQKWESNDIAFHQHDANPLLVQYFEALSLPQSSRIFVPLCGKTLDISWLLAQGYCVAGAELAVTAVEQLFEGLGVEPTISELGQIKRYSATHIDIFVGSIFDVSAEALGPIHAIYDRAALVALPEAMRRQYTAHLQEITGTAPQLLVTFEYEQRLMEGPPFSISQVELEQHYGDRYGLSLLSSAEVDGGLKGRCAATENAWLLRGSHR